MSIGLEIKVGIFVVVTTLIIATMGVIFGKVDFSKDNGYDVRFEIVDASGVNKQVPVLYRGVKVGTVLGLALKGDNLIVTLKIKSDYQIPDNVIFAVRQQGFVGEKFVELERNQKIPATGFLHSDKIYDGRQSVVTMDAIVAKVDKAAEQISILVGALNDVFATEESKAALSGSIQNIRSISDNIDRLIASNDKKFDEIIENVRSLTKALDKIVTKNEENVNESIKDIKALTASLKNFSASVDTLMEKNKENLDVSMMNIKSITEKVDAAMSDIQGITKDLNEGKGTLGMLINDNETKEEIKSVVSNVKKMVSSVSDYKLYVTFGADYLIGINDARGYAHLRLYTKPNTFYQLGVSNSPRGRERVTTDYTLVTQPGNTLIPDGTLAVRSVSESNKSSKLAFSLQYGHIFEKIIGMRVGLFDSTVGGALDIYPLRNEDLSLTFEIYDFDSFSGGFEAYTRSYIKWVFFRNFFIQAGVEDILNNTKRSYSIGGGVRFADDDLKNFAGAAASAVK